MLIRSATNADAPQIRDLIFGVLAEYGLLAEHEGVDADLANIEDSYIRRGGLFDVVANETGHIVGTVGLYPQRDGVVELRKMYLLKSERGRGVGKMLLDRVLARARQLGFRRIELETSSKLVEAIALYKKYGFAPFQPQHFACRCDQAMMLDLESPPKNRES